MIKQTAAAVMTVFALGTLGAMAPATVEAKTSTQKKQEHKAKVAKAKSASKKKK